MVRHIIESSRDHINAINLKPSPDIIYIVLT